MERFWVEKYVLAAVLTLTVRRLFGFQRTKERWLTAVTAGAAVMSMNLGAGLLSRMTVEDWVMAVCEGVFVCTSLLVLGKIAYLPGKFRKKPVEELQETMSRERISHYTGALRELSKSFLAVPAGYPVPVISGADGVAMGKFNSVWNSRMEEQRVAVADQLTEISEILSDAVQRAYDTREDRKLETALGRKLRRRGISLKKAYLYENEWKRKEIYLYIRTGKRRCISNREVAELLSRQVGTRMMPARDSRAFVGSEYTGTCFVEQTNFEVLYGVEKETGGHQQISGDSFSFFHREEGQFVASLSDGMGSGLAAYQESELVVDLLEQFLEAGFSKETAAKMINSALVLKSDGQTFSTMDICSVDLYSGVCEFVKIGAATSFIRRDHWVETITSTSLPAGIFHQTDLDKTCRKLYDGDMVILVTDGVLDALPAEHQEKLMKDIILEHPTNNPKELADYILNRVKQYRENQCRDDCTVLVAGIWKK